MCLIKYNVYDLDSLMGILCLCHAFHSNVLLSEIQNYFYAIINVLVFDSIRHSQVCLIKEKHCVSATRYLYYVFAISYSLFV